MKTEKIEENANKKTFSSRTTTTKARGMKKQLHGKLQDHKIQCLRRVLSCSLEDLRGLIFRKRKTASRAYQFVEGPLEKAEETIKKGKRF